MTETTTPPLVDAGRARRRLEALADLGIGHRRAAVLAGISFRTVQRIRRGKARRIRREVERAILNVTQPSLARGTRVYGYETRQLIQALVREGFPKLRLLRHLKMKGHDLGFDHHDVKVSSALRVRQLYYFLLPDEAAL